MQIHADPITVNCRKVLAGLDFLGVPFELVHVDYFTGAHKVEPYLSINPNASVPSMVDGDLVLWESNAILQYAADKAGMNAQGRGQVPWDEKIETVGVFRTELQPIQRRQTS